MESLTLALYQIVPQHVMVSIDGGIHFDELTIVVVIVLWFLIRKKP